MSALGTPLFTIRPEERRGTFAAFATLLVITTGHTLLETARDALFLSKVPASQLPWMYLIIVAAALALQKLRKMDNRGPIALALVAAAIITGGFWVLAADITSRPWVLYALYVWSGLFASWVMVQFWTLLGRVYTARQAKVLYSFIGAGAVLGAVVGALGARVALAVVTPRAVLLVAAALFVVAVIPLALIRVDAPEADAVNAGAPRQVSSTMSSARQLFQNSFAVRILGISLLATVAVTLSDYLFKAKIAEAFSSDAQALGAWLSTFYAVTNTIALIVQLAIGPWVFRTLGVQRALFMFPILLVSAATSVLVSAALLAAVALKGIDGAMRYSVHKTSTELLLVPIPDGTRERVKPIIDLIGARGGQALASLLVLALVGIELASARIVASFVVVAGVLWVWLVITIREPYLDMFRETLQAGGLRGTAELPELDLGALEMLFEGLNSSRDIEVLASLELLAEQHRERLIPALILYHPSRDVVLRSLELFTQHDRSDFVSIADRLNGHPDREVAAAALRARTRAAPDRKLLEKRLGEPCLQVAATALVSLIARGWIEPAEADRRLNETIATRSWQAVAELARTIRDVAPDPSVEDRAVTTRFDELLTRLAREAGQFHDVACEPKRDGSGSELREPGLWGHVELDPDVAIRLEVARAMAARRQPSFLPVLVGMLGRHELRSTARGAIAQISGALDFLDDVLKRPDFARNIRIHLPRTMIELDPALAGAKLTAHLASQSDGAIRFKILRALVRLRRQNPDVSLDDDGLLLVLEATVAHATELRSWSYALSTTEEDAPPLSMTTADPLRAAHHLLHELVRDKQAHTTQRVFMLLELLYREDFDVIERGLRSGNPKTRANSLELIENIVEPPLRELVVALADASSERSASLTYEEALRAILERGGATLQTLAEYRALELGIDLGRRSSPPTIESIGARLVNRARDLLRPDTGELQPISPGASRAPA